MPTISRFYGILVRMFYDDKHSPHFHVVYAGIVHSFRLKMVRFSLAICRAARINWCWNGWHCIAPS